MKLSIEIYGRKLEVSEENDDLMLSVVLSLIDDLLRGAGYCYDGQIGIVQEDEI